MVLTLNIKYLQPDNTIDVLSSQTLSDYELYFRPITGSPLVTESSNLGEILFETGLIESKTWARKNGWWKSVSGGYQEVLFGKNKVKLCIFVSYLPI